MDWESLGIVSGATLLGASGLQSLAAVVVGKKRAIKRRQRCIARRARFRQRLTAELKYARAAKPIFKAWAGEREFRVAAVVDEALGYKSFYLAPADGRPLPPFEPGQYLTFSLPTDAQRKPIVRCYSLSERPREDFYRVTIKLAEPPAGSRNAPAGQGSSYFHHRVKVGNSLRVQAPQGAFFLNPTDQLPIALVSGGVGVTPLLSMVSQIVHERSERQVYWFAGFRNSQEHPCREQMASLAQAENIHYDVCYSRPLAEDLLGRDYNYHGHATIVRLRQVLPSNNYRFYVCGPPGMMEQLVPGLRNWGVPEPHIHFEAFGPASVQGLNKSAGLTGPCHVEFAKANAQLVWNGEYPSLLDMAENEGVVLESGCRAGNCGQCLVRVRSGNVTHTKTPGIPLEADECLACIGIPLGDVVLEA